MKAPRRTRVPARLKVPTGVVYGPRGLVPVVVQDHDTGKLLMVAYATRGAVALTARTRQAHFFSRTRGKLWRKGETSGNVLDVISIRIDCDRDTLLYTVRPRGPACHTGAVSCFETAPTPALLTPAGETVERSVPGPVPAVGVIAEVDRVIQGRKSAPPEGSYTARLLGEGLDKILRKVTEETTEVLLAAKDGDREGLAWEVADVVYHLLVLLAERGVGLDKVLDQMVGRRGRPPRGSK